MFDDNKKIRILEYINELKQLNDGKRHEASKKEAFTALVAEIFPNYKEHLKKIRQGAEYYLAFEHVKGSSDTLFSNLIVEFKDRVSVSLQDAMLELTKYISILNSKYNQNLNALEHVFESQKYLGVVTDGIEWRVFATSILNDVEEGVYSQNRETLKLIPSDNFILNENNTEDFYQFLDRIFFKENSLSPTSKALCLEFSENSVAYRGFYPQLINVFEIAREDIDEVQTAFSSWQSYLKYTYGNIEGSSELFISHTYLSAFIKILMAHVFASADKKTLSFDDIESILRGQYFYNLNIRNYVEKDFFSWINFDQDISNQLKQIWHRIFDNLKRYDFSKIEMDFLKDIYEQLVDPKDRHDLGEYYTPDWLCEKIVKEALNDWNKTDLPKLADITCGSGSFLRAAILEYKNKFKVKNTKSITESIVGFEIHPMAVFVAKTNYMLAMGREMILKASEPVSIPVYLSDSLLCDENSDLPIEHTKDSIWSFIKNNSLKPLEFKNKFDVIVGNPPWLTFNSIENDDYKRELLELGLNQYNIIPKASRLRASMDIAIVFLAHGVEFYLKNKGNLFFVLPRSVFSSDTWECLRKNLFSVEMTIEELWDLQQIKKVFNILSCVLHVSHSKKLENLDKIRGKILGVLEDHNVDFYVNSMNERTSISTHKINIKNNNSFYSKNFKRGAELTPRSYYFVNVLEDCQNKDIVFAKTHDSIIKNAKAPYNKVKMEAFVNTEYLFKTCIAENVLPFAVDNYYMIHLPVRKVNDEWFFGVEAEDSKKWFDDVELSFAELQKNYESSQHCLNWNNKLLSQNPEAKYWVLYCTSGRNICSAVYENDSLFWADTKTYYFCPNSKDEAYYLAGVLNAEYINEIIKPFQSERDVHKKVLEVGIPQYSSKNELMQTISQKSIALSKEITKCLTNFKDIKSLGKKRNNIREAYSKQFDEINELVKILFKTS